MIAHKQPYLNQIFWWIRTISILSDVHIAFMRAFRKAVDGRGRAGEPRMRKVNFHQEPNLGGDILSPISDTRPRHLVGTGS